MESILFYNGKILNGSIPVGTLGEVVEIHLLQKIENSNNSVSNNETTIKNTEYSDIKNTNNQKFNENEEFDGIKLQNEKIAQIYEKDILIKNGKKYKIISRINKKNPFSKMFQINQNFKIELQ